MEHTPPNKKSIAIGLGAVLVCAIIGIVASSSKKQATTPSLPVKTGPDQTSPVVDQIDTTTTSSTSMMTYKDGTYSATGSYFSPGGPDKLGVELTVTNDIVTELTVTPEPGDGTSARYQAKFISGIKEYVVGKKMSDIKITKVSGSSLTGQGFNDALAQIQKAARV